MLMPLVSCFFFYDLSMEGLCPTPAALKLALVLPLGLLDEHATSPGTAESNPLVTRSRELCAM